MSQELNPQGVEAFIEAMNFGADAETALSVYLMNAWRPIESAPKDGTEILGYVPMSMLEAMGDTFESGPFYYVCWWNSSDGGFETDECGSLELSHWMPLPEPPSKGEQG